MFRFKFVLAMLAAAGLTTRAFADFNTPLTASELPWSRPASNTAATGTDTTYQEWDGFTSATDSSAPSVIDNPNNAITTAASDSSSATDGAFLIGSPRGDIYSFSDVIHPQVVIAGYGIPGNDVNVVVELQSWGTIDDAPGLLVDGVSASSLAGYSYNQISSVDVDAGFGPSPVIDQEWTFALPDAASLELDWTWGSVSTAFQDLSVDTQSVPAPAPEPASLGVLGVGAALLMGRRLRGK